MPKSGTLQKLGGKKKEDWQEVAVTLDERGLAWESQGAGGALRDKVAGSQKLLAPDLVTSSPFTRALRRSLLCSPSLSSPLP